MHYEDVSHRRETIRAADNAYTLRLRYRRSSLLFLTEKPRFIFCRKYKEEKRYQMRSSKSVGSTSVSLSDELIRNRLE